MLAWRQWPQQHPDTVGDRPSFSAVRVNGVVRHEADPEKRRLEPEPAAGGPEVDRGSVNACVQGCRVVDVVCRAGTQLRLSRAVFLHAGAFGGDDWKQDCLAGRHGAARAAGPRGAGEKPHRSALVDGAVIPCWIVERTVGIRGTDRPLPPGCRPLPVRFAGISLVWLHDAECAAGRRRHCDQAGDSASRKYGKRETAHHFWIPISAGAPHSWENGPVTMRRGEASTAGTSAWQSAPWPPAGRSSRVRWSGPPKN